MQSLPRSRNPPVSDQAEAIIKEIVEALYERCGINFGVDADAPVDGRVGGVGHHVDPATGEVRLGVVFDFLVGNRNSYCLLDPGFEAIHANEFRRLYLQRGVALKNVGLENRMGGAAGRREAVDELARLSGHNRWR